MSRTDTYHVPVLLQEVLSALCIQRGSTYIDATAGGGGHTRAILARGGNVYAIDQDEDAITHLDDTIHAISPTQISGSCEVIRGNFSQLADIVRIQHIRHIKGILFDLGMSSHQIDQSGRGFSYKRDEVLDMRMDDRETETAYDIIRNAKKDVLYEIFSTYAEELNARAIADAIVHARSVNRDVRTTQDLVQVITEAIGTEKLDNKIVARIFQALRISVNDEIGAIKKGIFDALNVLDSGGRIVVLSYHSLEDRVIKLAFREYVRKGKAKDITKRPVQATEQEKQDNSRSKAAKMRVIEKI